MGGASDVTGSMSEKVSVDSQSAAWQLISIEPRVPAVASPSAVRFILSLDVLISSNDMALVFGQSSDCNINMIRQ